MKTNGWQKICLVFFLFIVASGLWLTQSRAAESHVPDGITMQEGFKPGFGETLGIFTKTIGQVLLVHASDTSGYWADKDLPLYMKDTVVTPEEGLALMQFLDDSTISVAEDSELVINRFIFDPDKFDRSIFLNMDSGRARFWVKKLKGYTRSEFKVKTKTLIAGVRGSDFVLLAGPDFSEAVALDDTIIEIVSLAALDKVIMLRAFEKVRVGVSQEASPIEKVSPSEAARLRNELPMPFDPGGVDGTGLLKTERTVSPDAVDKKLRPAKEDGAAPVLDVGRETVVLIPEEDLVEPDPAVEEKSGEESPETEGVGGGGTTDDEDGIIDPPHILDEAIETSITEDAILVPLPGLPGGPSD